MKRVRLENIEIDLKERLGNEEFKRLYKIECAKIAIAKERMAQEFKGQTSKLQDSH